MSQSDYFSKIAADYDEVFNLIDVVFSLESCLHYQVLPLELSDDHLVLGMTDPKDKEAVKFVLPIVQSLGYTFHIQSIDTQTHQLVLAAYLKRSPNDAPPKNSVQSTPKITASTWVKQTTQDSTPNQATYNSPTLIDIPEGFPPNQPTYNSPTLIDIPEDSIPADILNQIAQSTEEKTINNFSNVVKETVQESAPNQPTYNSPTLIDIPEGSIPADILNQISQSTEEKTINNLSNSPTIVEIPQEQEEKIPKKNINYKETLVIESNLELDFDSDQPQLFSSQPQLKINGKPVTEQDHKSGSIDESLSSQEKHINTLEESKINLKDYPPKFLWRELLKQILSGEIDKIYLQKQNSYGSILFSQDGIVTPLLEEISISVFQEIIQEIKVMAKLPLTTLEKYKKVAIPKLYNQTRVLLRVELFPSQHGEEVTLQVFKGDALKFYEQRQADRTIEQAINLAQKLEQTLGKMKKYQTAADLGDLSQLQSIMEHIEQNLNSLKNNKINQY